MTYAPMRQAPMTLPVSSFMAEAHDRLPEGTQIRCVGVTETAAEKLVALTRRTAMELAGLNPSSRIGGFLRDRSVVFQRVEGKGLHYIRVRWRPRRW